MENTTHATGATVSESVPTTETASTPATPGARTADIAASVIGDLEAQAAGTPETQTSPEPVAPAQTPAEEPLSPAAQFLLKQGHRNKFSSDGRDTRLPFKTVEKMLERYAEESRAAWTGEKTTMETDLRAALEALDLVRRGVQGDPLVFLQELAGVNPAFQRYLTPPDPARQPATDDDPEPVPDFDLGNGQKTYTLDGLRKREEWLTRQLEKVVDARVRPIAEREQAEKARQAQEQADRDLAERGRKEMADAQTWPLFGPLHADGQTLTPFQQEVLAELQQESARALAERRRPTMSLRQAYLEVYARHQEPEKVRERAFQEVNAAPRSTAVANLNPAGRTSLKPRSTADIARDIATQLDRGA